MFHLIIYLTLHMLRFFSPSCLMFNFTISHFAIHVPPIHSSEYSAFNGKCCKVVSSLLPPFRTVCVRGSYIRLVICVHELLRRKTIATVRTNPTARTARTERKIIHQTFEASSSLTTLRLNLKGSPYGEWKPCK